MRFINFLEKEKELRDNQVLNLPFEKLRSQKVELEKVIEKWEINKASLNKVQADAIPGAKRLLKRVNNILEAL